MLAFLVPLRSKRTSLRWDEVCFHYRGCLASLLAQDHPDFHVVTICHEVPEGLEADPRHTVLAVDFPPPEKGVFEMRRDKSRKCALGLEWLRGKPFTHFMFVDSDDRVSSRLAGFVNHHQSAAGWYLNRGYHWKSWSRGLSLWKNFHRFCGSSYIFPAAVLEAPIGDAVTFYDGVLDHTRALGELGSRGWDLAPLPFPGGVYVYTRRDNLSYRQRYFWLWGWKRWWQSRPSRAPLSRELCREFSLPSQSQELP